MNLENEFRLLVSGYFGVSEMDEYSSKEYVLNEIENYIKEFINHYSFINYDYRKIAEEIENTSLKNKLQDSLLVLNRIKAPLELTLLIRRKINELKEN